MFRWFLQPVGDDNYLMVAAVGLLLLVLLWTVPAPGKTTTRRRRTLLGLRLAVIAMLILAMLRPTLVLMESKPQAATIAILADASRSMTVADESHGRSRWDRLVGTFEECQDALAELSKAYEVQVYLFDADARQVDVQGGAVDLGGTPDGRQTAIGWTIDDLQHRNSGILMLATILLSDGAQRAYAPHDMLPQAAAERMAQLGFPLYTVCFGQSRGVGQIEDVAVTELLAAQTVFVKNQLPVTAQVRIDGLVNKQIPVRLLAESGGKMEVVDQKTITAKKSGETQQVEFTYVPQQAGEFKLTVEVDNQPGELVTTNNRLSTFVNVLKGGLQVLYIEGTPRRETPFLRHALAAAPGVNLKSVWLNSFAPKSRRPADMDEWFKPGKFDVYILGDVDSSLFDRQQLIDLANVVSKGAGLIMLGGFHSFGPGGYAVTDLAKVLPIEMDRLERTPLGSPPNKNHHLSAVKMRPVPRFQDHFSLRIAPTAAESQALWQQLPALEGANRWDLSRVKQGALVLATTEKEDPLLVAKQHGDGRVMAFAGDSTWHWPMQGFGAAHERFWRQTILWLGKKDEGGEGNVWIELPRRRFNPADPVDFNVGARNAKGEAVTDATFKAEIELPDGTRRPLSIVQNADKQSGNFRDTLQAGDYRLHVTAIAGGAELGTAQSRFLVSEQDLELDNAIANRTMMEDLAKTTRGKAVEPERLAEFLRDLAKQRENLEVKTEVKRTFWDTWPFMALMVGLLTIEWYLRKRWGLV
jgi:hypothetical protein